MYMATPQQQQHLLLLHLLFGPVCCLTDVSLVWHVVYSFRDGGGGGGVGGGGSELVVTSKRCGWLV